MTLEWMRNIIKILCVKLCKWSDYWKDQVWVRKRCSLYQCLNVLMQEELRIWTGMLYQTSLPLLEKVFNRIFIRPKWNFGRIMVWRPSVCLSVCPSVRPSVSHIMSAQYLEKFLSDSHGTCLNVLMKEILRIWTGMLFLTSLPLLEKAFDRILCYGVRPSVCLSGHTDRHLLGTKIPNKCTSVRTSVCPSVRPSVRHIMSAQYLENFLSDSHGTW